MKDKHNAEQTGRSLVEPTIPRAKLPLGATQNQMQIIGGVNQVIGALSTFVESSKRHCLEDAPSTREAQLLALGALRSAVKCAEKQIIAEVAKNSTMPHHNLDTESSQIECPEKEILPQETRVEYLDTT